MRATICEFRQVPDTKGEMDVLLDHIDGAVDEQQIHGQRRIAAQELRKQWREQQAPHQGRRANADSARWRVAAARQHRLHLPEFTKDRFGALIEDAPIVGERELARGPHQ